MKTLWVFHQADLTEIQIINKDINELNRRTIYRTFTSINQSKGNERRLEFGG